MKNKLDFNLTNLGFITVSAISPNVYIGNPKKNIEEIKKYIKSVDSDVIVFPELSLTGYTCGDLFNQSILHEQVINHLIRFEYYLNETNKHKNKIIVIGAPLKFGNKLYNCAVVYANCKIVAIIPKKYLPNYNEFYEKRWFSSWDIDEIKEYFINNFIDESLSHTVPFGSNIIIQDFRNDIKLGIEICEDLWMPISPSNYLALGGANIIANLSASNDIVGKNEYRKDLVKMQSAKNICGYIYCSASPSESTSDVVFSGHKIIADNGKINCETNYKNNVLTGYIDISKCENDRQKFNSFNDNNNVPKMHIVNIETKKVKNSFVPEYFIDNQPFVPKNKTKRIQRCLEIIDIQALGLAQRLKKINCKKVVLGISGGLDSTLALLICLKTFNINKLDIKGIIGITMPGFGTSNRTKNNSNLLMDALHITSYSIDIKEACNIHLRDINHENHNFDITYENVQARERTQILMDMANKENAIVVGTGDLSELALGWCTYNGDHMSMYAVNVSIPKTLIKYIIETFKDNFEDLLLETKNIDFETAKRVLKDILDTPVSPELLPPDKNGKISQVTENSIGKYIYHDFFLYNTIRNGFSPFKTVVLAFIAFESDTKEKQLEIINTAKIFYSRFFSQQFKRNCLPDGPKVGSVSLSPRGDWRMPSDGDSEIWLDELKTIEMLIKHDDLNNLLNEKFNL